jgi:L-aspartate oxidase
MAGDVVQERRVVTEPEHADTVRRSVNAERPDLVVVGAGAAGLFACLCAAREGARVALVSARPLAETASYWAQGGLAAALAVEDSPERHLEDTIAAGRGLVRRSAAAVLCAEAPDRFRHLEALGVRFDADRHGNLALGLEGGHGFRRVVHAGGSATGRRILRQLSADVAEHAAIDVLEGTRAAALLIAADGRCIGVELEDGRAIAARGVVLATGGTAALWSRTTNPPGSYGSGLLLARAAGAALADLEFAQFHPTAVVGVKGREGFLISEAVRGEGATLHDANGERFVDELAPRDAVARAIFRILREQDAKAVRLDMRGVDPGRFPNVVAALREAGLDPMTELVPVAPASHYAMGGIVTDLDGRSQLPGLYAVGECACTGLHGANRLASNSLSECFVFGRRGALHALDQAAPGPVESSTDPVAPPPTRDTRKAMWRHAGLERDAAGLHALLDEPHPLARLVARCALFREESRGAHARADFPDTDAALDHRHTVVESGTEEPRLERWQ